MGRSSKSKNNNPPSREPSGRTFIPTDGISQHNEDIRHAKQRRETREKRNEKKRRVEQAELDHENSVTSDSESESDESSSSESESDKESGKKKKKKSRKSSKGRSQKKQPAKKKRVVLTDDELPNVRESAASHVGARKGSGTSHRNDSPSEVDVPSQRNNNTGTNHDGNAEDGEGSSDELGEWNDELGGERPPIASANHDTTNNGVSESDRNIAVDPEEQAHRRITESEAAGLLRRPTSPMPALPFPESSRATSTVTSRASSVAALSSDDLGLDLLETQSQSSARSAVAPTRQHDRARLKDFSGTEKKAVSAGTARHKVYFVTKKPFASDLEVLAIAEKAWKDTCKVLDFPETTDLERKSRITQTMSHGTSNVRSLLHDRLRPMASAGYRFQDTEPSNGDKVKANQELYASLTARDPNTNKDLRNYTYVNFNIDGDPNERSHPFQHKFVGKLIQEQFFINSQSPGIQLSEHFDPITKELIAFIYAMARHCIEEWKSGCFVKDTFNAASYKETYTGILSDLEALHEDEGTWVIMETLRKRIYTNARARCGVPDIQRAEVAVTSVKATDIERMTRDGLLDD